MVTHTTGATDMGHTDRPQKHRAPQGPDSSLPSAQNWQVRRRGRPMPAPVSKGWSWSALTTGRAAPP